MTRDTTRIPLPAAAFAHIQKLIKARPMTPIEEAFRAGVAMGMGIDSAWLLDDDVGEWIHPDEAKTNTNGRAGREGDGQTPPAVTAGPSRLSGGGVAS